MHVLKRNPNMLYGGVKNNAVAGAALRSRARLCWAHKHAVLYVCNFGLNPLFYEVPINSHHKYEKEKFSLMQGHKKFAIREVKAVVAKCRTRFLALGSFVSCSGLTSEGFFL